MTKTIATAGGRKGSVRARKSTGLWLRGLRVQSPSLTQKTASKTSNAALTRADKRAFARRFAVTGRYLAGEITHVQAARLIGGAA